MLGRVINAVQVAQQRPGQRAQLQQLMPLPARPGQPGHLDAQHDPHMIQPHLGDQRREARPRVSPGSRMPQVLIDHQHPRRRPPQRHRPLGQPVLQPRGLGMVLHRAWVDWRTYTAASRSRCQDWTLPSARSQGSLAVMLTALTPVPATRRAHHPLDQQSQQTAREHPVHLRERLPHRRGYPRLPAQGGTAASPGTAHLPYPSRPAPHAAAAYLRPRPAGRQFLGQEENPLGSIRLCMQSGLLLEHIFRDSKLGAALRHLPSGYPQVNLAWMWGALLAATMAAWLHQLTGLTAGKDILAGHGVRGGKAMIATCAGG